MLRTSIVLALVSLVAFAARFEDVPEEVRALTGEELVSYVNKNAKWQAGINRKFEGLPKEELKKYLGVLEKPPHLPKRGKVVTTTKLGKVPDKFDAVEAWPQCKKIIGIIQDQSRCGSCWAVATTSVMSDRLCIASNASISTSISAVDLMACCNFCGFQCQGGYPDEALSYFTYTGIVTGSGYVENSLCKPYPVAPCYKDSVTKSRKCPKEPSHIRCKKECQSTYTQEKYPNDKYYGKNVKHFNKNNDAAIAELVENGSLSAAFSVYEDFYLYKGGIYQYTAGSYLGGHAVRIIGYGTENGIPYWKVSNSWGNDWGEQGNFRIRRDSNECGFDSQILAVDADISKSEKNKHHN